MVPPDPDWDGRASSATYPAGVPSSYAYPDVVACRLLDDAAQDFPDVVAVEYRGYRLTYRKLVDHVDRLATALTALGVAPGHRVAVVLPTCPQAVIALFATWRVGAVAALVHRDEGPHLAALEPRVVVTTDRWYGSAVAEVRASMAPSTPVIVTAREDYLPFPRNMAASLRNRLRGARDDMILPLSDLIRRSHPTTGGRAAPDADAVTTARAVSTTQHHLVVNSFQLRLWLPDVVAGDERMLLAVPLTSMAGVVWLLTAVLSAATIVLVDHSRTARRQRAAMRARPTILPLDAQLTGDLLRSSWRRGLLSSVRIAVSTDALDERSSAALEQVTDKGRVRRAWGIRGVLTHADPIYGRVLSGSVGLPLPDTATAVVDPATGRARPASDRGHVWIRGPQLCSGEWVDAATDGTLDADGYLTVLPDAAQEHVQTDD
ncbi:MAG TPA: AMP-binding protein [Euzebyales bacterium]